MLRTIDIDDGVWQALQTRVKHFEETPNDVLRRVLNVNGSATRGRNLTPTVKNRSKDSRQDRVRAIIEATVARDPDMELLESNRVRIHFAPRAWTAPELMRGSTKSGKILQFVVVNRPTKLRLHMVICPGDHDTRRRIRESLQNQSWFSGLGAGCLRCGTGSSGRTSYTLAITRTTARMKSGFRAGSQRCSPTSS